MFGREIQNTYPNGFTIKTEYDAIGNTTVNKDINNQLIWQLNALSASNEVEQYTYGNGIVTSVNRDPLHHLVSVLHGNILQQLYNFEATTGNLLSRQYNNLTNSTSLYEQFNYDNVDRLKKSQQFLVNQQNLVPTNNIVNVNFDVTGNITHKDDAGDYNYSLPAKPFQLTSITNPVQNNISLNTLNVQYNDFRKVTAISEMGSNKNMSFVYGTDYQRLMMNYSIGGNNQYTRYYGEGYDREETQTGYKEWDYIYAPSGLCAVFHTNNGNSQLMYALTDHLGSPVLLTSNSPNPQIIEEYAFDSWGRRKNPIDWSYSNVPVAQFMIRGYTMHEMLDEFSIINMSGRIYDPVLGRFIQPDNYVQNPSLLQNFDRYAYCLNNPLKYSDPSGEWIQFALGAVVGGVINVATNWDNIHGFWQGAGFFMVGAASGAVSVLGPGGMLVGGAILGAGNAALMGRSSDEIIQSAFIGAIAGFIGGVAAQGLGQVATPILKNAINSPVVRGVLVGALGGAGGGYAGGFIGGLLSTGNLKAAHQSGMKGLALGLGLGAAMGAGSGYAEAVTNEIDPWTGKYLGAPEAMQRIEVNALPQTPREDLIMDQQQGWEKFGEHFKDLNLTYGMDGRVIYENMAREVYRNYDTRIQYSNKSEVYPGETHFFINNNLLRLDPSGKFRSFYPIKP